MKTTALLYCCLIFIAATVAYSDELPSRVDNSTRKFFPPVAKQHVDACAQFGAIHYTFTYEINRVRNKNAAFIDNQYAPLFSWNFLNAAHNGGSEFFDAWRIAQQIGIPSFPDWNVPTNRTISGWPDGYSHYYSAMKNRAASWRLFPMTNEEQLVEAKRWLWNAGNTNSAAGGLLVCDYRVKDWQIAQLPAGNYESGKWFVKAWSATNWGHVMTIAGYDDNVGFDYNGDGQITNDKDIDGDGQVSLADHERGAFIIVNSWGGDWADHGRIYAPYRHHATTTWTRGRWLAALNVASNVQPRVALKMRFTVNDRANLKLSAEFDSVVCELPPFSRSPVSRDGVVPNSPEEEHSQFLRAGPHVGHCPLAGVSNNAPLEMGFDLTPFSTNSASQIRIALSAHDGAALEGRVESASLLFYSETGTVTQQLALVTNTTSFSRDGLKLAATTSKETPPKTAALDPKFPMIGNCRDDHFQSLEKTVPCQNAPGHDATAELPGIKADGSTLLPNMWSLRPAGRQIALGDFPVNVAIHPSGKFAAVLHAGHGKHKISIVDLASEKVIVDEPVSETWYGLTFSRDGGTLLASGSSDEVLHLYSFADGKLSGHKKIELRPSKERGIPAGIAISRDGATAYAANVWGHRVSVVDVKNEKSADIAIGKSAPVSTANLPKPSDDPDIQAAEKRQQQLQDATKSGDPFPYSCTLDEKRGRLYVSLWALASVAVIDLKTQAEVARWATQEHPNEMLLSKDGKRLFVANANRNTATMIDTESGRTMETLSGTLTPDAPPGNTPNSLALSPDESLLFIANANVNNVTVFDISSPGRSRSLGFIPAGWYPTSVRVTPDGKKLLIANGKGGSSFPNPLGPEPVKHSSRSTSEYIGGLMKGTLSIIDLPKKLDDLETALKAWTGVAMSCSPAAAEHKRVESPLPPVKYCIYVIKENRTYDQVLGDMKEGNGDPSLCLFPEKVTPNLHALARDFVLLDNFYCEGEVSADGHEWTMGAYASDFVEKNWPLSYGHGKSGKFPYPSEGGLPIAAGSGGYLWDKAAEAGVTYRSYAEFCANTGKPGTPMKAKVPALVGHIDEQFRGFDMDYPDVKRAERFIDELRRFEREGDMPRLQIVRFGNDHTFGTSNGKPTPTAMVAENDLAVGMFVEAVSKSKFWKDTAIFIVEDDAQNGSDHVDAHRTTAFLVSPWTRGRGKDSTMYSTCSMLRTMELILGLKPMSQFDAAATPMTASFTAKADVAPFIAKPANVDINEKNTLLSWGAKKSSKMNFAKEDAADDLLLNEVIWRSVRGANSPMPAPVRAAFVFASAKEDDDD